MKHLLGFNEAWDYRKASKWIDPTTMAQYWANVVQPVAYAMDMTMISPTFSMDPDHI